jgi:hypothetical protein
VSKEIVQSGDLNKYHPSEIQNHLLAALHEPTDKISRSDSYLPSSRFIADNIWTGKFFRFLQVAGFSINPEYCAGKYQDPSRLASILSLSYRNRLDKWISLFTACLGHYIYANQPNEMVSFW